MHLDRISVASAILVVIAVVSVTAFIVQHPFESFVYATPPDRFINVTQDIGAEDSRFMWSYRTTDLMAQAFAIFAASVACLAMLRGGEREDG